MTSRWLLLPIVLLPASGCGSSGAAGAADGSAPVAIVFPSGDAGAADAGDATPGDARAKYPAFTPDIGQIVSWGGPVLRSPRIVSIYWADDPGAASLADYTQRLGPSTYWRTLEEYGIGAAATGPAEQVVIQTPPPVGWSDTDLVTWVVQSLGATPSTWPAPDAETVYVVYTPPGMEVTSGGADICSAGYNETGLLPEVQGVPNVPYLLVFGACDWTFTSLMGVTQQGSVALPGVVASPQASNVAVGQDPTGIFGWEGFDADHYAWELFVEGYDQVAYACSNFTDDFFVATPDLPYAVGRIWSNRAAAGGHNPCAPAEPRPYYSVTPLAPESLDVTVGWLALVPQTVQTKGYRVKPGSSRSFQVGLYSDAPTAAWSVQAVEGDGVNPPPAPVLTLTTDRDSGNNGDIITVTVAASGAPAGQTAELMTVVSTQDQLQRFTPIIIGTY